MICFFTRKIRFDIPCELSIRFAITFELSALHMKCQALFLRKVIENVAECCSSNVYCICKGGVYAFIICLRIPPPTTCMCMKWGALGIKRIGQYWLVFMMDTRRLKLRKEISHQRPLKDSRLKRVLLLTWWVFSSVNQQNTTLFTLWYMS